MLMNRDEESEKAVVDKDFLEAELFEAISHPTRIQILRSLSKDALGFSELKHKLEISSSGNLSHHLNKLVTLVETNTQGKYKLTDQGREALFAIEATQVIDEGWMATTNAFISALIFYALYLTVAIIVARTDLFTLVSALISAISFYVIYRMILARRLGRETMRLGWQKREVRRK
jgi:DNA-binding HxlR family transcriptional regulator